ncbi:sensor domain-containing protein [Prescottella defluvii]|uniref:sensor domain-containing protein n=1 Tax=Prescottella defluvii TaxID=1323361 RepID=UPI0004F3D909|nr:sensor domain-containing protein [Prescottella defluvii]
MFGGAAAGLVGLVLLALLCLSVLALPVALIGVVVFAATIPLIRAVDAAQRASVRFFGGGWIEAPTTPSGPTHWLRFVASVRDPALWRSVAYWTLRIPLALVAAPLIAAHLVILPALVAAPAVWVVTDPEKSDLAIGGVVDLPTVLVVALCAAVWLVVVPPPLTGRGGRPR